MKLKVLVADKFPDKYIQQMKDLDLEVIYQPKLGEKDLPEAAKATTTRRRAAPFRPPDSA